MSIMKISKIAGLVLLVVPFLVISCDDFQEETYEADPMDALGVEALSVQDFATTIKPMIISWSDSLLFYSLINTSNSDTAELTAFASIIDSMMQYDVTVMPVDSRIIQAFDTSGTLIGADTVLFSAVDTKLADLEVDTVDSVYVSVPVPNYLVSVGANTSGYSFLFNPGVSTKVQIFLDNHVNLRIIETSSMDSTDIVPADIPMELITSYYTLDSEENPKPILKSYTEVEMENQNYIIQLMKTENTVNSGKVYFSLLTE